jgi:hypothetical protein
MISRAGWYGNINVLFEIIKSQMGGRETVFLPFRPDENGKLKSTPPIRWLMANYIGMLQKHWERYNFLDEPMNLYYSLTTYTQMAMFSYSWRIKSQQQNLWLEEFKNYIKSYDVLIETDSPDLNLSFADAIQIKQFFDKYRIRYRCSFSGSKGVHLVIPSEEFDWLKWKVYDDVAEKNVRDFGQLLMSLPAGREVGNTKGNISINLDKVLLAKCLSFRLKMLLSCETLDTSVSDIKRICKTPYSMDCKNGNIALPLTDEQLLNFDKEICSPEKVLPVVYKRGLLWRNEDVPKEERDKGMAQMLTDLGILR